MPSSSLIIEELTGRQRRLTLVGPGLPLRGAGWSGEQRLVTQFYAGNTEATQQVLGPVDLPSDWNGIWNTTRLLGTPQLLEESGAKTQIGRAFSLYETFESIVRAGSLLRVTWIAGDAQKIMREGRIGTYSFKPDRADDIAWQAQFVWIGRGGEETKTTPRDDSVETVFHAMNQSLSDLRSALIGSSLGAQLPDLPTEIPRLGFDDLAALADTPSRLLGQLTTEVSNVQGRVSRTVGLIEQVRGIPDQLANQAQISARDTRAVAKDVMTRLSRVPSESFAAPGVGVGRSLRLAKVSHDSHRAAVKTEGTALAVANAARRAQPKPSGRLGDLPGPSDALMIHIVRAGETFATIARRYYGDASLGGEIARANRYPRYAVSPTVGMRLLIPAQVRGAGQA